MIKNIIFTMLILTIIILNIYFYIFLSLNKDMEIKTLKQNNHNLIIELSDLYRSHYILLNKLDENRNDDVSYKIHIYDYTGKPYFQTGHIIIEEQKFRKTNLFEEIDQLTKKINENEQAYCSFLVHYISNNYK